MKLSLIVRGQHPPGDTVRHLHEDLELVRCADRLGFDGIVKGSHYSAHPFESVQQIPFLSYCAAIAPRLRIICGLVLVPLHKPLDLAEQLATLDHLSGGKLVFGAGIGYRDVEFKAFGVPRGQLGARFEECLAAIRRLWTEDFVSMKGAGFELDHATCAVKPLQKPTPPIWIGANADVAIRRAARIGDCWYINPHNTLATIERQMDLYKRALDEYGRPFPAEVPMRREVFVAKTRAEAIRRAQPYLEEKYKAYRSWGQDKVMPEGDDFDHTFDVLLEDRFLLGSPAEVADQLNRLNERLGVNHLVASIHWPGMPNSLALEQLHLLADEAVCSHRGFFVSFPSFAQTGSVRMNRLDGKVALISGAARGIGGETAQLMANEGARVVVADVLDDRGRQTVAAITDAGGQSVYAHLDVTSEEDWTAAVNLAASKFGKLDILVNNAGVFIGKGIEEITLDEWNRLVAVNMTGVFLGTRLAARALRDAAKTSEHGSAIVNLASIAGIVGSQLDPLYSMTKGGVTLFTKSAALEFARKGYRIRVNSIHPGVIQTDMGEQTFVARAQRSGSNDTSQVRQTVTDTVPWGRLGVPMDIAKGIVFLASDDAGYMNGAGLIVDGGVTAT